MNPSVPRNRSRFDRVSTCALVLVSAEVIITDIPYQGQGRRRATRALRTLEVENEDEDEDGEDEVECEESSSSDEDTVLALNIAQI